MVEKGKVKWFSQHKGYGFIERDNQEDLFFHINDVVGLRKNELIDGLPVVFIVGEGKKGPAAKQVEALDAQRQISQKDRVSVDTSRKLFLNPYNFVRNLETTRRQNDILGDMSPPPHDRYVGLTGEITCELTVTTPLFISDSHDIHEDAEGHKEYRFFKVKNEKGEFEPALPGTSLRGMIRSVFETITNSCLSVFDDTRLSRKFNTTKATWLVPARVEKSNDDWQLRLLPGMNDIQIAPEGEESFRSGEQYAAWLHQYWPIKPSRTLREPSGQRTRAFRATREPSTEVNLKDFSHGKSCYALVVPCTHAHPAIKYWDVIEISDDRATLATKQRGRQRVVQGWLCLNNQNIESKHSERLFFDTNPSPIFVNLPKNAIEDYEALIADYQKRHRTTVEQRQRDGYEPHEPVGDKAGFSRFVYERDALKVSQGTLVYAMLKGDVDAPEVEFIAPVAIPRLAYKQSTCQLLPSSHLCHCSQYNRLCPACRVFGWVHEATAELEKEERVAYAGRVRVSHGRITHYAGTVDNPEEGIMLAILASPKPTKTQFYLLHKNGRPDKDVDYNTKDAQLRGRKFYYHHGDEPSRHRKGYEYQRATNEKHLGKDDQNRTVQEVLKKGTNFHFTLDFENFAPKELGALLWALEMEDGMHHRLGYAKPLGFGSVTIRVTNLSVIDWSTRLKSLEVEAGHQDALSHKKQWMQDFIKAMENMYGESFDTLMGELKILLSKPAVDLPIHYPRLQPQPDPEGKNFEWFQQREDKTLDLVQEDGGLPL